MEQIHGFISDCGELEEFEDEGVNFSCLGIFRGGVEERVDDIMVN